MVRIFLADEVSLDRLHDDMFVSILPTPTKWCVCKRPSRQRLHKPVVDRNARRLIARLVMYDLDGVVSGFRLWREEHWYPRESERMITGAVVCWG